MNINSICAIQILPLYQDKKIQIENTKKNHYPAINLLNFCGNYNKKLIDIPIQNDKEFCRVMRRVKHAKIKADNIWQILNPFRAKVWIHRRYKHLFPEYKNASKVEMGLIPYCGENDNSEVINMFLSNRLGEVASLNHYVRMPKSDNSCADVIRALDYSLKNLDKEFGKYKGIVFRVGYMSEEGNQYFSTSKSLNLMKRIHPASYNFNPHVGYSVLRLKNGHKIYEFQHKMGSHFAKSEDEVLTDRNSKFKKLLQEEIDEELMNAKTELAENLFIGANKVMAGIESNYYRYSKESLLKFINVYEEI